MAHRSEHWADKVAELCGAAALAGGAGASAWLIAPLSGAPPAPLAAAAALVGGVAGWAIMRATPHSRTPSALPEFELAPVSPSVADDSEALDVPLGEPNHGGESRRVFQLFGDTAAQTPGELQARIERHLGEASHQSAGKVPTERGHAQDIPDASDALHAALNEIRQSLRGH